MKSLTPIVSVLWIVASVMAADHSKPELHRSQVYIYRKTSIVAVKIYHCLYDDTRNAYYDITDYCLRAFKTGIFIDKWNDRNKKNSRNVRLEEYTTKADLLTNEIFLRSGTVCRYDRGFCYDTKESINYAAVWQVTDISLKMCPDKLEKVFYGFVDIWDFKTKNLKYLFYYEQRSDRAFFLNIGNNTTMCHNKVVWNAGDEFLVSKWQLTKYSRPTLLLNEKYFPLKSKKSVTEAIMRDYDLREYPFDFDKKIDKSHLSDDDNLKTILKRFQELLMDYGIQLRNSSSTTDKTRNDAIINSILKSVDSLKISLAEKGAQIKKVNQKCIETETESRLTKKDLMDVKNLIKENHHQQNWTFNSIISEIYNKLHQEDETVSGRLDSQSEDLIRLQQNLDELEMVIRKHVDNFLKKKELEDILFNLEGESIQKIEDNRRNLTGILDEKERAFMKLYESGQVDISHKYNELFTKVDEYYDSINMAANDLSHHIESKFQSTEKFLLDKIESQDLKIIPKLDILSDNITYLNTEIDACKEVASSSLQSQLIDSSSLRENISTIHQISIRNYEHITQLINRLNETLELIDRKTDDISETNKQYVPENELRSILAASERNSHQKFSGLVKNVTLLEADQENKMREYYDEKIQKNVLPLIKKIQSKCEDAIQDFEISIYSKFLDLEQQVFTNISFLGNISSILTIVIPQLEKNIENKIEIAESNIENLINDVNVFKDDFSRISMKGDATFENISNNLTELYKNAYDENKNLMNLKFKLEEVESKCNDIDELSTNISVNLLDEVRHTIGAQLKTKLDESEKSTLENYSMLRSDLNEFKKENEENYIFIKEKIEHTETIMRAMGQSIVNHGILLLNSSSTNREVMENVASNLTEIQDIIQIHEDKISQMNSDLNQVKSNISDVITEISRISNDWTKTGETLERIDETIATIDDTLLTQINRTDEIKYNIGEISNNLQDMNNSIIMNEGSIQQLNSSIKINMNSSQSALERVREELDSCKISASATMLLNEENLNTIRQNISNYFLQLARSNSDMMNIKSQMKGILENLQKNEKAIEDAKISTISVGEEIAQIHVMLIDDRTTVNKVENELSIKIGKCCDHSEKKLSDYENTTDQLKKMFLKVKEQLMAENADLNSRLKYLENQFAPPSDPDDYLISSA